MDSLRLISFRPRNPSWIWIRYIQYATTGTTLCHPQNWLCRCDAFIPLSTPLNSPLVHFNGYNARLSTRRTKLTVTPKFVSSNCNMAFAKLQRTQSLARPTTRAAFLNFLITPFHLLTHYETRSTNANYIFHAANKTILKNTFRLSASYFFIPPFISHNLTRK